MVDLDTDNPTMTISGTLVEPRKGYVDRHHRQETTKNNQIRTFLLADAVAEVLRDRRASSRYTAPTDPLLASDQGTFMWAANMRQRLRTAIAYEAGLDAARMQLGHSIAGSTPLSAYVAHRRLAPDHRPILDRLFRDAVPRDPAPVAT